jgi:hypothetical protein
MTLPLQQKRINSNADKSQRQSRSEIIAQMRHVQAPGDLSSQRFLSRTLDGPAELAQISLYSGKR